MTTGSVLNVFSDSDANDVNIFNAVIQQAVQKQIKVIYKSNYKRYEIVVYNCRSILLLLEIATMETLV